jgi:hypothetical protein
MVAFVWIYRGLVPKLIFQHEDEVTMINGLGIEFLDTMTTLSVIGWGEIVFGVFFLLTWRIRHMLLLNMVIMVGALANIAVTAPQYLIAAFNPVTLNLLMITLSLIGFIAGRDVSSAER